MARGIIFQMDQATPADRSILRYFVECREDSSLDSNIGLRTCVDHKEAVESGPESLHNSTDFERHTFRENAHFTGVFGGVAH